MQEIWIQLLGGKDLLEEISCLGNLAWEILWTEEPGRLTVHGVTKSRLD